MNNLSKRETQVLSYCAVGLSAKEIADRICRSPETVRKTIANVKLKSGLQKATELTAFYICRYFGDEYEDFRRRILAVCMLALLLTSVRNTDCFARRARGRRNETVIEIMEQ